MTENNKTVFETPWFSIVETKNQDNPYYCLSRDDGVICLLLNDLGDLVLVQQYRAPLGRTTLEMPAGAIENNETPEQAAIREIIEETGCRPKELLYVAPLRMLLNREDAVEHFFIAIGVEPYPGAKKEEGIDIIRYARSDFQKLVTKGDFEQSVALGGIFTAEQMLGFNFFKDKISTILTIIRQATNSQERKVDSI